MSAAEPDPLRIAAQVCAVLESLGVTYSIGGSIASSLSGEPRSTLDIDIVVSLEASHVEPLTRAVEADFYVDPSAVERAVRDRASANLIHRDTSVKIDLFIAGGTPLDNDLLRRRVLIRVGESGTPLYTHTPEDILLQKLRWYRRGGDVSDRQWRDVLGIVRVQGSRLDRDYMSDGATRLGVHDLLSRALREGDA